MNEAVPGLTPPTKEGRAKAAKAPKVEKDPNAPKKPRNPRTDYGYAADSIIRIVEGKDSKYRGQRKEWYDSLVACNGQTVGTWAESRKAQKDPPRGWLRFYVQDGSVTLERSATPAAPATPAA